MYLNALHLLNSSMEANKVVLRHVWSVGMHRHGPRELAVGSVYYLEHQPNNPYDRNAIAVVDRKDGNVRTLAYLRRQDAVHISKLFRDDVNSSYIYIKAKASPEVWNRRIGSATKMRYRI